MKQEDWVYKKRTMVRRVKQDIMEVRNWKVRDRVHQLRFMRWILRILPRRCFAVFIPFFGFFAENIKIGKLSKKYSVCKWKPTFFYLLSRCAMRGYYKISWSVDCRNISNWKRYTLKLIWTQFHMKNLPGGSLVFGGGRGFLLMYGLFAA